MVVQQTAVSCLLPRRSGIALESALETWGSLNYHNLHSGLSSCLYMFACMIPAHCTIMLSGHQHSTRLKLTWKATHLYSAADTVRVRTELEFRLAHPTWIAWAEIRVTLEYDFRERTTAEHTIGVSQDQSDHSVSNPRGN
jgi:hypothetical protein